ncbi:CBS domain-containing protein / transporter associated domain-containing protein [Artemisia annua]|uniref:CBS domain-containing protein / transporter associated domain-containing protein n=1 Tax=Artemisia annua TaxID=35608 RepID=A0A2U1N0U2_ARTAN|nr:CBS domain-containing protein / transporter associated domain-containing protein [Artemisia annua]
MNLIGDVKGKVAAMIDNAGVWLLLSKRVFGCCSAVIKEEIEKKTGYLVMRAEGIYDVDANTSIDQLSEDLNIKMPEGHQYETVSGFVCEAFGYIPKTGESIKVVLEKEEDHDEYTEEDGDRQNPKEKEKNQVFKIEILAGNARKVGSVRFERVTHEEETTDPETNHTTIEPLSVDLSIFFIRRTLHYKTQIQTPINSNSFCPFSSISYANLEEEAHRNSTMPDMLFIALSHKLSPFIYSLDSHCKQLSDKDRIKVKEQIDPIARFVLQCLLMHIVAFTLSDMIFGFEQWCLEVWNSGGMNGYISLCVGDPCPTIFR